MNRRAKALLLASALALSLLTGPGSAAADGGKTITITAGGDCTLGSDRGKAGSSTFSGVLAAQRNDYSYFFKLLQPYFAEDDLTLVNCEGTFTDSTRAAARAFNFKGGADYAQAFRAGSVEAVSIANNHIHDYGDEGVRDTRRALFDAGISYAGEGTYGGYDAGGVKVGVLAYNLVLGAGPTKEKFIHDVRYMRRVYPVVIVMFHWGNELVERINGDQAAFGRLAIDNGADLVVGSHPHIVQGIERYKGKYIVYSLGNLCFGGSANPTDDDEILFQQRFTIGPDGRARDAGIRVVPCRVSSDRRNNFQPMPYTDAGDVQRVVKKIADRSKKLTYGLGEIPTQWTAGQP